MPGGDTDKNCMRGEHDDQFDWENTQNWNRILLSKVKKKWNVQNYIVMKQPSLPLLKKPSLKYKSKDDLSAPMQISVIYTSV